MVRCPPAAVHQPHTYTVIGTKARDWRTVAVVLLLLYCIPGMMSDDVSMCFIAAVDVKMLWFDVLLLLCTNHTHTP